MSIRIAGVDLPYEKNIITALRYIKGIGAHFAKIICDKNSLDPQRRVKTLTDAEISALHKMIDKDFVVEGDLRRLVAMNVKRLKDIACYRGLRHRKALPVRGQRTRTNSRTCKRNRK